MFLGQGVFKVNWQGQEKPLLVHVLDRNAMALWGRDAVHAFQMELGKVYGRATPEIEVLAIESRALEVAKFWRRTELFLSGLGECTVTKRVEVK